MGWTSLFLQNQPFFGEKRIDQKIPQKSKIFGARNDSFVSLALLGKNVILIKFQLLLEY